MENRDLTVCMNQSIWGSKPLSNISGLQVGEFLPALLLWHRSAWRLFLSLSLGSQAEWIAFSPVSMMTKSGKGTWKRKKRILQLHPWSDWLANFSHMGPVGLRGREQTTCAQSEEIRIHEFPLAQSILGLQRYCWHACGLVNYNSPFSIPSLPLHRVQILFVTFFGLLTSKWQVFKKDQLSKWAFKLRRAIFWLTVSLKPHHKVSAVSSALGDDLECWSDVFWRSLHALIFFSPPFCPFFCIILLDPPRHRWKLQLCSKPFSWVRNSGGPKSSSIKTTYT